MHRAIGANEITGFAGYTGINLFWCMLLGLAIIATVLVFPRGLAGAADALRGRARTPATAAASA